MIAQSAQNISLLVYRLLVEPRGVNVDDFKQEVGIVDRTWRRYRHFLREQFTPFRRADGSSMVQELQVGDQRFLRLVDVEQTAAESQEFLGRITAAHLARQMFSFVEGTDVGTALEDLVGELESGLQDRRFVMAHLFRNLDRIIYVVPDAPKDYSSHAVEISQLIQALVRTRLVKFTYASPSREPFELQLRPLSLLSYRSALYLLGRTSADAPVRTWAIDRMEAVEVATTGSPIPPPTNSIQPPSPRAALASSMKPTPNPSTST